MSAIRRLTMIIANRKRGQAALHNGSASILMGDSVLLSWTNLGMERPVSYWLGLIDESILLYCAVPSG